MAIQIKKAVRERIFLKLVVTGASGSGKTFGALGIAKGLAPTGKVLMIDTENRSASYYAGRWDFDVIELEAPFTTQKYNEALQAAIDGGYEVVVLDSLTHEWEGSGGLQDQKAAKDARGGNSYTNWNEMKAAHRKFVEKLLQSKIHVIGTLRSKMSYVLEQDEKGKAVPRKVGMAPISADDMEYEFGVMFDVDRNSHLAIASKDRTGLFEARNLNLDEGIGREIAAWLASGAEMAPEPPKPEPKTTGEVFSQMAPPAAQPVSQEAIDFVEGVDPTPKPVPAPAFITTEQWEELTVWANQKATLGAQLKAYCIKKGWLKPDAQGLNTLAASCWEALHNQITERSVGFIAHLDSHFPAPAAAPAETATESIPTKTRRAKTAA